MFKKILLIFVILCLVFSFIVPCFANVNYVDNIIDVSSYYIKGNHIGGNNSGGTFLGNNVLTYNHYYYLKYSYISGDITNPDGNFIYYRSGTYYPTLVPKSSMLSTYDTIFLCNNADNRAFIIKYFGNLLCDIVVFDLTELYGEVIPDISDVRSDLSFFSDTFPTRQVNNTVGSPFIQFFSHLFEPFHYISEIGQTGYFFQPLILIGAVVGLLVFIFVCVFLIKRFTGGKT